MHSAIRALIALCFLLAGFCLARAQDVAMLSGPQVAIQLPTSPKAPTNLVVIACRVDDLTGQPGRQGVDPVTGVYDANQSAKDWRDLEPHIVNGELQCKREVSQLQDRDVALDPSGHLVKPLNSNFGDLGQCAHIGAYWGPQYEKEHRGWAVFAVGCPVPIVDQQGVIIDWKMPDCPNRIGGLEGIKCRFDGSLI